MKDSGLGVQGDTEADCPLYKRFIERVINFMDRQRAAWQDSDKNSGP